MPDRMGHIGQNLRQLNWQEEELVSFQKNFYNEHPDVAKMSTQQAEKALKELNANIEGRKPHPRPVMKFDQIGMPEELLQSVRSAGFDAPTPIQGIGWPTALSGRDMVGIAQTGSGKTLAYLLPGIVHINAQPPLRPGDGPVGLILAPTRELAMQIQSEVMRFTEGSRIRSTVPRCCESHLEYCNVLYAYSIPFIFFFTCVSSPTLVTWKISFWLFCPA